MSKARTLADFISDGSEFADGTISVAEVSGAAPLASPTFTGTTTVSGDLSVFNDNGISAIYDFKSDHYSQIQLTSDVDNSSLGGPYTVQIVANGNNGDLELRTNTVQYMAIAQSGNVTFNEYSYDADFRVESDTQSHMLFVDAANDKVGIATVPSSRLHIKDTNTSTGSTNPPHLRIEGNNGLFYDIGRDNAGTGFLSFYGNQTNANGYIFGGVNGERMRINQDGTMIHQQGAVFNESGGASDFRVETDGYTNAFLMDASDNRANFQVPVIAQGLVGDFPISNGAQLGKYPSGSGDADGGELALVIDGAGSWSIDNSLGRVRWHLGDSSGVGERDIAKIEVLAGHNGTTTSSKMRFITTDYNSAIDKNALELLPDGGAVFNQDGVSLSDFRVESDAYSHIMFVDASENRVSIGHNSSAGYGSGHVLSVAGGSTMFSNFGADKVMQIRGGNYTDPHTASILLSGGSGDNGYVREWYMSSVASGGGGAIQNDLKFRYVAGGSATQYEALNLRHNGEVIVNEDGWGTHDFRVESDTQSHMLFVDAGNNSVGINNSSPSKELDVYGGIEGRQVSSGQARQGSVGLSGAWQTRWILLQKTAPTPIFVMEGYYIATSFTDGSWGRFRIYMPYNSTSVTASFSETSVIGAANHKIQTVTYNGESWLAIRLEYANVSSWSFNGIANGLESDIHDLTVVSSGVTVVSTHATST